MIRWRPRLAGVLFGVNLLIILLPLGGIAILRLYDSELIRRTETELNAQGALVASMYRTELLRSLSSAKAVRTARSGLSTYGLALARKRPNPKNLSERWTPIEPLLDIAKDRVYPRAPDAVESDVPPDPLGESIGKRITPVLLGARRVTLSGVRVTDFRAIVVASTQGDLGKSLINQEEVKRALSGAHVSLLRQRVDEGPTPSVSSISRGGRVRVFVTMPIIERDRLLGVVLLSRTPIGSSKALNLNRFYLLSGGVTVLLLMCVATALTTLIITRPLKALILQARQVTRGETKAVAAPLKRPGTYEVELLSKALAQMSAALVKRSDYIRTFASNVSHEFKTPLTSIRGTVELLKDHFADMAPEVRERFLNILEQDAARLARLVRRLLDLAKAEVAQPGTDRAQVTEVLKRVTERFRSYDLSLTYDLRSEEQQVAMAPEVLESILSNLVDNARQHGGSQVSVHLSTRPEKVAGRDLVEIIVQDNGPGVSESDCGRIFTPFFTTARESGGTGLGLSIVRALVTAHHGTITLEGSASGARFSILLPAHPSAVTT
ncbi:MAG: HAMP domain-containing sensor histidine kinase [Desulfomonilaceae bacterium]